MSETRAPYGAPPPLTLETDPRAPLEMLRPAKKIDIAALSRGFDGKLPAGGRIDCRWSEDGQPENLEAAIADAIEWMDKLHTRLVASGQRENAGKLAGAIRSLARYGCILTQDEFAEYELPPGTPPAA